MRVRCDCNARALRYHRIAIAAHAHRSRNWKLSCTYEDVTLHENLSLGSTLIQFAQITQLQSVASVPMGYTLRLSWKLSSNLKLHLSFKRFARQPSTSAHRQHACNKNGSSLYIHVQNAVELGEIRLSDNH
jgi:hypothetical protein